MVVRGGQGAGDATNIYNQMVKGAKPKSEDEPTLLMIATKIAAISSGRLTREQVEESTRSIRECLDKIDKNSSGQLQTVISKLVIQSGFVKAAETRMFGGEENNLRDDITKLGQTLQKTEANYNEGETVKTLCQKFEKLNDTFLKSEERLKLIDEIDSLLSKKLDSLGEDTLDVIDKILEHFAALENLRPKKDFNSFSILVKLGKMEKQVEEKRDETSLEIRELKKAFREIPDELLQIRLAYYSVANALKSGQDLSVAVKKLNTALLVQSEGWPEHRKLLSNLNKMVLSLHTDESLQEVNEMINTKASYVDRAKNYIAERALQPDVINGAIDSKLNEIGIGRNGDENAINFANAIKPQTVIETLGGLEHAVHGKHRDLGKSLESVIDYLFDLYQDQIPSFRNISRDVAKALLKEKLSVILQKDNFEQIVALTFQDLNQLLIDLHEHNEPDWFKKDTKEFASEKASAVVDNSARILQTDTRRKDLVLMAKGFLKKTFYRLTHWILEKTRLVTKGTGLSKQVISEAKEGLPNVLPEREKLTDLVKRIPLDFGRTRIGRGEVDDLIDQHSEKIIWYLLDRLVEHAADRVDPPQEPTPAKLQDNYDNLFSSAHQYLFINKESAVGKAASVVASQEKGRLNPSLFIEKFCQNYQEWIFAPREQEQPSTIGQQAYSYYIQGQDAIIEGNTDEAKQLFQKADKLFEGCDQKTKEALGEMYVQWASLTKHTRVPQKPPETNVLTPLKERFQPRQDSKDIETSDQRARELYLKAARSGHKGERNKLIAYALENPLDNPAMHKEIFSMVKEKLRVAQTKDEMIEALQEMRKCYERGIAGTTISEDTIEAIDQEIFRINYPNIGRMQVLIEGYDFYEEIEESIPSETYEKLWSSP